MRGNALLHLFLCCLVSPAATAGSAQAVAIQRSVLSLIDTSKPAGNPVAFAPPTGDLLEFVDGSIMHGELKRMDTASGLRWENPAAKNPIDLQPDHVDSILFARASSVTLAPTARLHFVNGDDLLGTVASLDNDHLGFSTWFGGSLTIPRASVQSITFLSSNYTILYDGPVDTDGWIIGDRNPDSWTFRDGTFISGSAGTLGRDFNLSGSSTIEFDLAWSDNFQLLANIYGDAVDLNGGNSYLLMFTPDNITLGRIDSDRQLPRSTFGSVPLPNPAGKNKVRITIQSNKEEGTLAVFVDNILAKRWKDENGFSATGRGILFQQVGGRILFGQGVTAGVVVKLSNFRISQWQGRYEPEISAVTTNVDAVRFINHDHAAGKIAGIDSGKITLSMDGTLLQIPIQRVTQINFAATPHAAATRGPWEVRARFPRGGSVSFQLEKWNDKEVSGRSAIFGPLAFQPGQIRQLEFNLDHAKAAAPAAGGMEYEDLDE
jgi:hypothetical protein